MMLAPLEPSDMAEVMSLLDSEVLDALCWNEFDVNPANVANWLTASTTGVSRVWKLIASPSGAVLGVISLNDIDFVNRRATCKFAFVGRQFPRRAWLMLEMLKLMLAAAQSIGLHRIEGRCREDNFAIQGIYRRLKANFEGLLLDAVFFAGEFHSLALFSMIL